MARWVDGRRAGDGYWTNTVLTACEDCGVDLGPGEARLRRCDGCDDPGHAHPDPRGNPRGGTHARCRDEGACRRRQTPPSPGRRALAAAVARSNEDESPATSTPPEPSEAPGASEWPLCVWWTNATADVAEEES
jgi:hypothetical protein